jgi:hypothetical protein
MDLASASPIFATVTAARLPRNDWPEKGGEKGASLPIMRGMILSPLAIQLGIALIHDLVTSGHPARDCPDPRSFHRRFDVELCAPIAQGWRRADHSSDLP